MNPPRLIHTTHSTRRMKERHITRQMVRDTLAIGIRTPGIVYKGRRVTEFALHFGTRECVVFVAEYPTIRIIITVMWRPEHKGRTLNKKRRLKK